MSSRCFSGFFHYRKNKQRYGYLFSIKEVLSFPIITTRDKQLEDKCPNDPVRLTGLGKRRKTVICRQRI